MYLIQTNSASATARRVPVPIYADVNGTPWAGTVTGVTAALSIDGAAENATIGPSADVVRVGGEMHYVPLTQAQVNQPVGTRIYGRIPAAAGRLSAPFLVLITAYDPANAETAATIAAATETALADNITAVVAATEAALADNIAAVGTAVAALPSATAVGEAAALAVAGASDLRFDDTDGANLVVQRKSTSATVATVPLRRAARTNPVVGNG